MTRTGVFTAVEERRRTGRTLGWVMLLTLLMGSGVSAAQVENPSFETTYTGTPYPRLLPQGWWHVDHPSFNSYCTNLWKTNGALSAGLLSLRNKAVSRGNYESFYQYMDLTGIGTIKFDVRLAAYPDGAFAHFEAALLVDGVRLWSQNVGGVYPDQEVNVAGMAGWHRVEMRNTALDAGTYTLAYWTQWDNVRLIEGQLTIPAVVDLDPSTLNPASNGNWITCYLELEDGYDVSAIDGATVTLNGIPAYLGDQGWATAAANAENVADFDGDGVLERMVKFDRAAVQALVQPAEAVTVSIQGKLANVRLASGKWANSVLLEGTATIRVLDNKAKKP